MPLYTYRCKKCDHCLDIMRSFDQYQDLPKDTDPNYKPCITVEEDHVWEKELGTFKLTKGVSWGPGKGHWGRS